MNVIFGDLNPGETAIEDVSGLRIPEVKTRAQLSLAEGENIRKVIVKYFGATPTWEMAPFDLTWAKGLHGEMFGDVWDWAGQFRTSDLNLGCAWSQIQERLYDLLETLKYWKENQFDLIEQAARLHYGAVMIHPFQNGNGRWGRMLTDIWLTLHGGQAVAWPEQMAGTESLIRKEYIAAIQECDQGNYEPLIAMHNRYLRSE